MRQGILDRRPHIRRPELRDHRPIQKLDHRMHNALRIHPQSIVHSMIEFLDGSVIAQLGTPDMRTPIQYALTHPERFDGCSTRLEWSKIKEMTFEVPDERFPALQLGYEVIRLGGTSGAVVNAANEIANEMFRAGNIRFGEIVGLSLIHISEPTRRTPISYAVFCLKKK